MSPQAVTRSRIGDTRRHRDRIHLTHPSSFRVACIMSPSASSSSSSSSFTSALQQISSLLPEHLRSPPIGIVCGSGLSGLADSMRDKVIIPYEHIDGFGKSTVSGHLSALAFGLLGEGKGTPCVAMLGRVSYLVEPYWIQESLWTRSG